MREGSFSDFPFSVFRSFSFCVEVSLPASYYCSSPPVVGGYTSRRKLIDTAEYSLACFRFGPRIQSIDAAPCI